MSLTYRPEPQVRLIRYGGGLKLAGATPQAREVAGPQWLLGKTSVNKDSATLEIQKEKGDQRPG